MHALDSHRLHQNQSEGVHITNFFLGEDPRPPFMLYILLEFTLAPLPRLQALFPGFSILNAKKAEIGPGD